MSTLRPALRFLGCLLGTVVLIPLVLVAALTATFARTAGLRLGSVATQLWGMMLHRALGVHVRVEGPLPPRGAFVACNHLSYIDILVLGATYRSTFVAKQELGGWPLIGPMIRGAGTLLIDRERARDAKRINAELRGLLEKGHRITLFPEGTSGSGKGILPFKAALFAPPAALGVPCVPATLTYSTPGADPALGGPSQTVCWWNDMPFAPHFFKLARLRRIEAVLRFGEPVSGITERKQLADAVRSRILDLFEPVPD
ncbi:MAG TPA: lysophospholipid acyltransferase family protein [Planctomycetota bacterium]